MAMPMIHATEIVPYAPDRQLVRCHGCGARLWAENAEQAKALEREHRIRPTEEVAPEHKVVVVARKDTGRTEIKEFTGRDAMRRATTFMDHEMRDPHKWGWSYALLAGTATPAHVLNELAEGARALELESGTPELEG